MKTLIGSGATTDLAKESLDQVGGWQATPTSGIPKLKETKLIEVLLMPARVWGKFSLEVGCVTLAGRMADFGETLLIAG